MTPRLHRSRVILVLFVLFLAVLLVPLLVGATVFTIQLRAIEDRVLEAKLESLERNRIIIDTVANRVHERLTRIRGHEGIAELSLASYPFPAERVLELRSVYEASDLTAALDPYVLEMMVYLARPRILLAHEDVYLNRDIYFRQTLGAAQEDRQQWIADLEDPTYYNYRTRVVTLDLRSGPRRVIEISQSLPITQRLERRGAVYAFIDIDAISELMASALAGDGGFAFIRLPSGERIAATSEDLPVGPLQPMRAAEPVRILETGATLVVELQSEATNWTYIAGFPRDVFFREARQVRAIFVIVAAVVLFIGLLVASVLTYGTSQPLIRLQSMITAGVLSERPGPVRPLRYLRELVNESVKRTSSLQRLVEDQRPFMRRMVIDRLFRGDFSSRGELSAFLDHYGLAMKSAAYGVACILIEGDYDDVDTSILREFLVRNALVKKLIADALPDGTLVNDVSLNRIGLVIPYSLDVDVGEASHRTEEIVGELEALLGDDPRVSCILSSGGAVPALTEIPEALEAALEAPAAATPTRSANADNAMVRKETWYYYPAELEMHLSALVLSGRADEVRNRADEILEENFARRALPLRAQKLLVKDVQATLAKLCAELGLDSEAESTIVGVGGRTLQEKTELLLDAMTNLAQVERMPRSVGLDAAALVRFVDENYTNPDMGLKLVAAEFGLTEEYVSTLFRSAAGKGFGDYLEGRRMGDARRRLAEATPSIQGVAEAVGYRSAHAFRRAFKRHFGYSPSEARHRRRPNVAP